MIGAIPSEEIVLLGADLNAHVGEKSDGYTRNHGGERYGNRNVEGEKMLESLESLDLTLVNTCFKKKEEHKITYKSGSHKTQIDFIVTRRESLRIFTDCKVIPGEETVQQHKLVIGRMNLKAQREYLSKRIPKIKTWNLKEEKARQFKEKVTIARAGTEGLSKDMNANVRWNNVKDIMLKAAEEVCGISKGGKRVDKEAWWWNEEVQSIIKEKRKAFKAWQKDGSDHLEAIYKDKKKKAKQAVAKAKEACYKEWYEKLGTKEGEQTIYRIAKQRANSRKDIGDVKVLRDKNGDMLTEGDKIRERWREYFNSLLNVENNREPLSEAKPVEGPIEELTRKEIIEALKKMKTGKAAGCSEIKADMIKVLEEVGVDILYEVIGAVWEDETMPDDWSRSEIIPIFKQKGDPMECGNYRGIKLLEHGMKILEKIIESRLRKLVEIDEMQFGFMPGRSTTEAIFMMQQISEKHLEKNQELITVFVDLEKAYDRVPRDLVYWCMRTRGIPEKLVRLVQATYQNTVTMVRTPFGKTEEFDIKVGLHQGSGLSPLLFLIVLDTISNEFKKGLPWELLFADDLAIMAESEEEAQRKWLRWQIGMESKGLKVNTGKTEVLVIGKNPTKVSIVDKEGKTLKQVESFKYLGATFSSDGGSETTVRSRVKAAWCKWRELGPVIADKKIPVKLKVKLYTTVVRPVLLYGAECWTGGSKIERLLEATEMRMLRRIKGVTLKDKVKSVDIRKELRVQDIKEKARESRLRWYGHVKRREATNHLRLVMEMEVPGRRPRGRPKGRWRDRLASDMRLLRVADDDVHDRRFWARRIRAADPSTG